MRKRLFVSPDAKMWKIQLEGGRLVSSHFKKEVAVKRACSIGKSLSTEGVCAQVLIQRADGTFQEERTYKKDPFPPRG